MQGRRDLAAAASATRNLLLPFGRAEADRAPGDAAAP